MIRRIGRVWATRKIIRKANKNGSSIYWGTGVDENTVFEGANTSWKGSAVPGSFVGYASYIGTNTKLSHTRIGRYCSIAADVSLLFGNHPSRDYVSTHNAFCFKEGYSVCYTNEQHYFTSEEITPFADAADQSFCVIGNDVWIGKGVKIKCGVTIGDGAIVGAYAFVTKDVPPYGIVGGIPAKLIRYRFEEEDIKWLQELQWWNKDKEWLEKYGRYFYDIKELKDRIQ